MASENVVVIERALSQLFSLYTSIARKRAMCEAVCKDCRQLLKPWPLKKSSQASGGGDSAGLGQEDAKAMASSESAAKNALISKELEVLSLVDKALARAEKTRKVLTTKLSEDVKRERFADKENSSTDGFTPIDNKTATCVVTMTQEAAPSKHGITSRQSNSIAPKRPITNENRGDVVHKSGDRKVVAAAVGIETASVISQTSLDGLMEEVGGVSIRKQAPTLVLPREAARCTLDPLPLRKATSRYKPAHQTAPFKTTISVAPRRQRLPMVTTSRNNTQKSVASVKTQRQSDIPPVRRPTTVAAMTTHLVPTGDSSPSSLVADINNKTTTTMAVPSMMVGNSTTKSHSSAGNVERWLETASSSATLSCQPECMVASSGERVGAQSRANQAPPMMTSAGQNSQAAFLLVRDGSHLKVPAELRKAASTNQSLREKLRVMAMTAKPSRRLRDNESSAEAFIARLNSIIADQCGGPSVVELLDEVKHCCDVYDWLTRLIQDIPDLDVLQLLPWQKAIQSQSILTFVLNEFADLEETYHTLSFKLPEPQEHKKAACSMHTQDGHVSQCGSLLMWLPDNFNRPKTELPHTPAILQYRNSRQLLKYMTLLHDVQLLMLQRHILLEAGFHAVKLLEEHPDPTDRTFNRLFASTFSLVTSFGQHFPITVRDSISDAS